MKNINITENIVIGDKSDSVVLFAGVCAIESLDHTLMMAEKIKQISLDNDIPLVFKASYDKANRSSVTSYRGVGKREGIDVLKAVKKEFSLPIVTDVHSCEEIEMAAEVADVIQVPAFLSRQTDLLVDAGKSGKIVNIKKGQFLSPSDVKPLIAKVKSTGNENIIITERGASFGYNNLVTDMRGFPIVRGFGVPMIFDATHSVQLPGGNGSSSGGDSRFVPFLSRAAVAAGVDGLFLEVHDNPAKALCDGPNAVALKDLPGLLAEIKAIDKLMRDMGVNKKVI